MTNEASLITTRLLLPEELAAIHAADLAIFPSRLSVDRLLSWQATRPDLFLAQCYDGTTIGLLCMLCIQEPHYTQLLDGYLQEHHIEPFMLASASQRHNLGYHIWHVERTQAWPSETKGSLGEWLGCYLETLQSDDNAKSMTISALTATEAGVKTFSRLGFRDHGCWDYIVRDAARQEEVRHCRPPESLCLAAGEEVIRACPIMVRRSLYRTNDTIAVDNARSLLDAQFMAQAHDR
jgi:hypothetical protein